MRAKFAAELIESRPKEHVVLFLSEDEWENLKTDLEILMACLREVHSAETPRTVLERDPELEPSFQTLVLKDLHKTLKRLGWL